MGLVRKMRLKLRTSKARRAMTLQVDSSRAAFEALKLRLVSIAKEC